MYDDLKIKSKIKTLRMILKIKTKFKNICFLHFLCCGCKTSHKDRINYLIYYVNVPSCFIHLAVIN